MDLKMKGFQTNKQSIYIDCKQLLRRLYRLRFKVAKRHRDSLFDKCLIPALLGMIRHFRRAYRFRDERVKELDEFLFSFEDFNSWVDVASEEKVIKDKEYASLFEYIERIYLCGIVEKRVGRFLERNPENNSFLIRGQFKINRLRRAA